MSLYLRRRERWTDAGSDFYVMLEGHPQPLYGFRLTNKDIDDLYLRLGDDWKHQLVKAAKLNTVERFLENLRAVGGLGMIEHSKSPGPRRGPNPADRAEASGHESGMDVRAGTAAPPKEPSAGAGEDAPRAAQLQTDLAQRNSRRAQRGPEP